MIPRLIEPHIYSRLTSLKKVVIVLGARQVGKTTLLMSLQSQLLQEGKSVRYLNCDLEEERQAVNTTSKVRLDLLVAGMDAILIDEVQRLDDPGLTLKILVDLYPDLMILVTGSSSFLLRSRISETLTGRYVDFFLYPLSLVEVLRFAEVIDDIALRKPTADALLNDLLRFGFYPEIYLEPNPITKQILLSKLEESYLFKDILSFYRIRYSQTIVDLANMN
jgi:predicted AAA+ superfamily ATPase